MSREEIIEIMSRKNSTALIPQYKEIYHIATGKPFRGCLCGNGMSNLIRACEGYASALKKQMEDEVNKKL